MTSPAAAIAWEFRQRHRWGLTALAVYLVLLAAVRLAIVASGRPVTLGSAASFALVVVVAFVPVFYAVIEELRERNERPKLTSAHHIEGGAEPAE